MKIIRYSDSSVILALGIPTVFKDQQKRLMKNCILYEVDNGLLILNGLTRAIVFLTDEENITENIENIYQYDFLYKNYFLVDDDFDEYAAFEKVRNLKRAPVDDLYLCNPSSYTIFTTTKCNARCFYCYELTMKDKRDMSLQTARKVAKYIRDYSPTNVPVKLAWFGGEPLYNAKVINEICNYLRDNGKEFYSTMTSNGYLFDAKLAKKAKNSWHLTQVQITIDGTEEVYNNAKRYIYKDKKSPYKKVMKSIEALLGEGINIGVRINVDTYNIEDTKILIREIHDRFEKFKGAAGLNVYVWPIFQDIDNPSFEKRTEEENILLYQELDKIEDLIVELGFNPTKSPSPALEFNECMVDNGSSVVISTDGDIGLCEHYPNEHFFSHIDHPLERDNEEIALWQEHINTREACTDCPILGECTQVKKCVELGVCDELKKNWMIKRYTLGLLDIYKKFKNNNQ